MKPLKFISVSTNNHKKTKSSSAMYLRFLAVIIVIFYLPQPPVFANHDQTRISHILKSASELDYPPFSLVTPDGKADGFSVDLLKATTKEIGHEISFSVGPWHELKQNLADGKIEVLPLVGYTPERDKVYDFSVPYLRMHGAFFTREGDTQIKSITELKNKKVLVMRGDNAHEFLEKKNIAMQLVLTDSYEEAFELLSKGKHDALFSQELVGLLLIKKLGINNLTSTKTLFPEFEQKFSFAVKDGDASLLAHLNEGLSLVVANGTYDRLYEKWFAAANPEPISITAMLKYAVAILSPIAIIVIVFIFVLKKEVLRKTSDLENELSGRKRAEEKLNESKAHFHNIFTYANDAIFIIDPEHNSIFDANPKASLLLGYSYEELLSIPISAIHPKEMDKMQAFAQQVFNKGSGWTDHLSCTSKLGKVIPAEISASATIFGGKSYLLALVRDITERKQAENALKENEARYRLLVEGARLIGWEYDPFKDCFTFVSGKAREITGYSPEEWYEKGFWAAHIHPEDRKYATEYCVASTEKCEDHDFEYRMLAANGRIIWCRDIVQVVSQDGKPVKLRGLLIDITERKMVQDNLKNAFNDLKEKNDELKKFHSVAVGRELDMIKLKEEVNLLLEELGRPKKYE